MPVFNSTLAKRRRFQPPITTFFSATTDAPSTDYATSHNHYAATTFTAHPVVPAKVQSSLLSVGMRIRKSVADGYKTQAELAKQKGLPSVVMMETSAPETYSGTGRAELASFSGTPRSSECPFTSNHLVTDDGDAFSLPPSSQESTTSSVSLPSAVNGQKRTLDDDIFADEDTYLNDDDDAGRDSWRNDSLGRTILSPSLGQQRRRVLALQQKSVALAAPTMDLDDFEEASFLRRREEVDADYVRMDCA